MILIDSREQQGPYIQKQFLANDIDAEICCFPQDTGCDYLISQEHGSVAIQRKVAIPELLSELDETMFETLPRLRNFSENPVLLVEENLGITPQGYLFNRANLQDTSMLATSYYGYLETIRKMGVDVYQTRDLNQSIWLMIAWHNYLAKEHYPKHRKFFNDKEVAIGMISCVPGIGEKRAEKALKETSIRGMTGMKKIVGLTVKQSEKLGRVLRLKL